MCTYIHRQLQSHLHGETQTLLYLQLSGRTWVLAGCQFHRGEKCEPQTSRDLFAHTRYSIIRKEKCICTYIHGQLQSHLHGET